MKAFLRLSGPLLPRLVGLACCGVLVSSPAVTFTNDTAIPFDSLAYDGQDVVVSNCTLTVDGWHTFASLRVTAGGMLTHSGSPTGLIVSLLSVTNAPLILTDTNPVTLPHSNIVTGTLRVTDASAAVVFTNGVDYALSDLGGGGVGLQRTTNSAIPDGGEVLVSYDVQLSLISVGLNLTVSGDVEVELGASINVKGRGYAGKSGGGGGGEAGSPVSGGGGGHGGYGGLSSSNAPGGIAYGAIATPTSLGGGGGSGATGPGGAGGGRIRLNVAGNLTLDGDISADGQNGLTSRSGGGAGGSVWITAQSLTGNGTISANGGNGEPIHGGGGGGGRVALDVATNLFSGVVTARGGAGFERGGAGTIYARPGTAPAAWEVTVENGGSVGAVTPFNSTDQLALRVRGGAVVAPATNQYVASLIVESNSWLTCLPNSVRIEMTVTGNAVFEAGGGINLRGKGYPSGQGLGAGVFYSSGPNGVNGSGGGGGHAGYGGMGAATNLSRGGDYYGSVRAPALPGSGGGGNEAYPGGAGGGVLLLTVSNLLHLDGLIIADGERAASGVAGGGAGGSIRLSVGTLAGSGEVSANGGAAHPPNGGGGAGGRIAIHYATNSFLGTVTAFGGTGFQNGAAGSFFQLANGAALAQIIVDNNGSPGTNTFLDSANILAPVDLTLQGGARASGLTDFWYLTVRSNAALVVGAGTAMQTVSVFRDARIESGGVLSLDGLGYPREQGPGAGKGSCMGSPGVCSSGGGGHGGNGGQGIHGPIYTAGGTAYDLLQSPREPGSGGGRNPGGGAGGGALRLDVGGLLHLDGRISAEGLPGGVDGAGGGAGGSLWLNLKRWTGNGVLSVNGGAGNMPNGSGGGGGRIAVAFETNEFTGTITARGGAGYVAGGAGTIYLKANAANIAQVTVDNGGLRGASTILKHAGPFDLALRGGARVTNDSTASVTFRNLFIGADSWYFPMGKYYPVQPLTVTSNAVIQSGGGISADGCGYSANQPYGGFAGRYKTSSYGYSSGGGGAYGGSGGNGALGADSAGGGDYYDSSSAGQMAQPYRLGSGGGAPTSSSGILQSAGGGALRLTVNGMLSLDGVVSANGLPGVELGAGGGSGGSLWITVGGLSGAGLISADGGAGHHPNGGGGGGGRIALYWTSNNFTGSIRALGGAGFSPGGAGTIFTTSTRLPYAHVLVDNNGQNGGTTWITYSAKPADLTIRNGGIATHDYSGMWTMRNLVIEPGSLLAGGATVEGDATVFAGGAISLTGKGSRPGEGIGAGNHSLRPKAGGSHAGIGGAAGQVPSFIFAGPVREPRTAGSGGANGSGLANVAPLGGAGGGAMRLDVAGVLTVDGNVSADGTAGSVDSGGGAGGSVWLTAGTLAGSGVISANGGAGNGWAGGGGGGRVAIYYQTNLFTGDVTARGGEAIWPGGAGTVYWEQTGSSNGWLIVSNGGLSGTNTPLMNLPARLNLLVSDGAIVHPQTSFPLFKSVRIGPGGWITSLASQPGFELVSAGDIVIAPGGALCADGQGFAANTGPGAGAWFSNQGGGGGHGGEGGRSSAGAIGGARYGSVTQPVDSGSGGGSDAPIGSAGGGGIRVKAAGALRVDGSVSANGQPGWQDNAGGGAGGSLWIMANALTGDGVISATGGDGEWFNGGGGGGGRIAIYAPSNTFTGLVSVAAGGGADAGQGGSVFVTTNLPGFEITAHTPSGVVSNLVAWLDLSFSEIVNAESVSAEDFLLFTPGGVLPQTSLGVSLLEPSTVRVIFPIQNAPGEYRLEAGPGVENLFGQPLSQVYTGAFTVVVPTISGTVTNAAGQGVPAVTLRPDGGLPATVTDALGRYLLGVPPGWNGSVSPALGGFSFVPGTRGYTNVTESITGADYLLVETLAPALNSVLAGDALWLAWHGIPGVSYQLLSSTNLTDWYPQGGVILGTNGVIQWPVPVGGSPAAFFRLKVEN